MDYSDYDRATTKLAEASAPQEKTFPEAVSFEGWEKESLKPNHWVVKRPDCPTTLHLVCGEWPRA